MMAFETVHHFNKIFKTQRVPSLPFTYDSSMILLLCVPITITISLVKKESAIVKYYATAGVTASSVPTAVSSSVGRA